MYSVSVRDDLLSGVLVLVSHAFESRGSKAFIRVCVSVSVHTIEPKQPKLYTITKLATGIVHHESWLVPI